MTVAGVETLTGLNVGRATSPALRSLAIVGSHPDTRENAPFDDPSFEIDQAKHSVGDLATHVVKVHVDPIGTKPPEGPRVVLDRIVGPVPLPAFGTVGRKHVRGGRCDRNGLNRGFGGYSRPPWPCPRRTGRAHPGALPGCWRGCLRVIFAGSCEFYRRGRVSTGRIIRAASAPAKPRGLDFSARRD